MESRLIYRKSEALRPKIDWIKPGETEWLYCGTKDEVKFEVVTNELIDFFVSDKFYIAVTRKNSFESSKESLLSSVTEFIGCKNFFVWDEDFQRVVEFNKIGVFRKGVSDVNTNNPIFKINPNKITPGSPDKVRGKLVKCRKGDCLSVDCGNGKYLGVFISQKFNKYYDLTLIEYLKDVKPSMNDFVNGRFFGRYVRSMDEFFPGVEKKMMPCLEIDADSSIESVGSIELREPLQLESYGSLKDIAELLQHYKEDLPQIRRNTEKYGDTPVDPLENFSRDNRLIEISKIIKKQDV